MWARGLARGIRPTSKAGHCGGVTTTSGRSGRRAGPAVGRFGSGARCALTHGLRQALQRSEGRRCSCGAQRVSGRWMPTGYEATFCGAAGRPWPAGSRASCPQLNQLLLTQQFAFGVVLGNAARLLERDTAAAP